MDGLRLQLIKRRVHAPSTCSKVKSFAKSLHYSVGSPESMMRKLRLRLSDLDPPYASPNRDYARSSSSLRIRVSAIEKPACTWGIWLISLQAGSRHFVENGFVRLHTD